MPSFSKMIYFYLFTFFFERVNPALVNIECIYTHIQTRIQMHRKHFI